MNFPNAEKQILKFWKKENIFKKSLNKNLRKKRFVFYDGPVTTNAQPGLHSLLSRIFKDIIPRFKTMQGFYVSRKNGWDTQGLPVELEVEKILGFKSKKEIQDYGIDKFNYACKKNVKKYVPIFKEMTERIGYWVDMEDPYITSDNKYIETLWWIIKRAWEKKLLYQGFRVAPYCPRCGTTLSSHEVAQGYKKVKELAIYVKFKIKSSNPIFKNTYLLVWTTTPWTLPGNVAIAINSEFKYVKVKKGNQYLILAKGRLEHCGIETKIEKEFKGKELLGLEYEPLFDLNKTNKKAYFVVEANYVSLEEGTGLVHTAPAFGEDDLETGKKNDLPVLLNVDKQGKFNSEVKEWEGMFVKKADPLIIECLKKRKLLFKEEIYEHDYPFCWRCKSPLLYYALKSWFIKMSSLKKELISNSKKVNWFPSHLKQGRFGEWLKGIKDWNLSRERYWGTPLPAWECESCNKQEVIGSKEELKNQKFTTNNFYILRHGFSLSNERKIFSCWPEKTLCPLTKKGEQDVRNISKKLRSKKIDIIISSDVLRTFQTAEIVSKEINVPVKIDKRIREISLPNFNGKRIEKLREFLGFDKKMSDLDYYSNRFKKMSSKGESYADIEKRMYNFIKDINGKYKNKNILIISHQCPLTLLEKAVNNYDLKKFVSLQKKKIKTAELRKLEFRHFPYDKDMNLDLHKPFIDEVKFLCPSCNGLMKRTTEVLDCWFDSGAMPFAQYHYPFENKELIDKKIQFPADYISEALDQTRGWFYTLLAISTLLGFESPYKNVVCLGLILDEKGKKMSKSKGNTVNPFEAIEEHGADAIRWYYFVVNQPGDSKNYDVKEIRSHWQRMGLTFWNCWNFLKTSLKKEKFDPYLLSSSFKPKHILDQWILSLTNDSIKIVTESLEKFDTTKASREIEDLIDNLSNWYVRRSRKRIKESKDKEELKVLYSVLFSITLMIAPFTPFLSETMFKELKKFSSKKLPESVHLMDWPKYELKNINKGLEEKMNEVLEIVKLSLSERANSGIKVRQPLRELKIKNQKLKNEKELIYLIEEEVNIKEIVFDNKIKNEISLNIKITKELKEEGMMRDIVRHIQKMRKNNGFKPKDKILIYYSGSEKMNELLDKNKEIILKETKAEKLALQEVDMNFNIQKKIQIDEKDLLIAIRKVNSK